LNLLIVDQQSTNKLNFTSIETERMTKRENEREGGGGTEECERDGTDKEKIRREVQ
jgi:hypothetical protein